MRSQTETQHTQTQHTHTKTQKYYRLPNINKMRILLCSKNDKIIEDVCKFLYFIFSDRAPNFDSYDWSMLGLQNPY